MLFVAITSGAFLELEHLHRHDPVVAHLAQRGGDRHEVHVAEAGTFQVAIVRVEIFEPARRSRG